MTQALSTRERLATAPKADNFFAPPERRSMLLVDVSGSMGETIRNPATGGTTTKIAELRKVVTDLRATHPVPVAAFGMQHGPAVALVDTIPDPSGMTPLHLGIDFAKGCGATHLVVVSDGEPDSQPLALDAARNFGGVIDVFFVGQEGSAGAKFLNQLAAATGGRGDVTTLTDTKRLTSKIVGLLEAGTPPPTSAIRL